MTDGPRRSCGFNERSAIGRRRNSAPGVDGNQRRRLPRCRNSTRVPLHPRDEMSENRAVFPAGTELPRQPTTKVHNPWNENESSRSHVIRLGRSRHRLVGDCVRAAPALRVGACDGTTDIRCANPRAFRTRDDTVATPKKFVCPANGCDTPAVPVPRARVGNVPARAEGFPPCSRTADERAREPHALTRPRPWGS